MKNLLLLIISIVTMNMTVAQTEVGSVTLDNNLNFGNSELILNGAGIRKKAMVLKLYSGGLYLGKKSKDAASIINADETMAIRLVITSSFVSSEAMKDAVNENSVENPHREHGDTPVVVCDSFSLCPSHFEISSVSNL